MKNRTATIAALAMGLNAGIPYILDDHRSLYSSKTVFSKPKMSTKEGSYGARKRRKKRKAQKVARKNNRKS